MSRSRRGGKGCGFDYWKGRPHSQYAPGSKTKRMTNRTERRTAKCDLAAEADRELAEDATVVLSDQDAAAVLDAIRHPPPPNPASRAAVKEHRLRHR